MELDSIVLGPIFSVLLEICFAGHFECFAGNLELDCTVLGPVLRQVGQLSFARSFPSGH